MKGEPDRKSGGSSPHTRGAPQHPYRAGHREGIIPAYAGSTGIRKRIGWCNRDHPRIRGEHVMTMPKLSRQQGSSPHTRGALLRLDEVKVLNGIIPAYAGSTLSSNVSRSGGRDHPRIRGEHNTFPRRLHPCQGSSPHTRGARASSRRRRLGGGIIPAYAGSTTCKAGGQLRQRDHPRIRGEHEVPAPEWFVKEGSSPHTRGAHPQADHGPRPDGIIPAYAGSTSKRTPKITGARDHPRIRGEHAAMKARENGLQGSSPHTRGAQPPTSFCFRFPGIIPAYAGSTRVTLWDEVFTRDHPRIRGEHICPAAAATRNPGSSPHTRGARYSIGNVGKKRRDHPRIRGEHATSSSGKCCTMGSSPHTRGALFQQVCHQLRSGIIPAYAGSTVRD